MDDLTSIYNIVSIILGMLLIISELLAWSDCKANAISQLFFCKNSDPIETIVLETVIITQEEETWSE